MESMLPPMTQHGAGFELTRVRQFTIFLDNRVGRLQALVRSLEEHDSTIVGLSVEESGDAALVRMICAKADLCRATLTSANFSFAESELLAVQVPKKGGGMIALCTALLSAEINIHYLYPLLRPPAGPTLALYVDDPTLAAQILIRKGFRIIGESDLDK
jgi:hypothetical protein